MSTQPKAFLTPEQYLEIERQAEFKSEYWQGEMFAMSGAAEPHNRLTSNISGQFYIQLRSRDCRLYSTSLRVPTWCPFRLQFYCNGHSYLARQMSQRDIQYRALDNAFGWIADFEQPLSKSTPS